MATTGHSDVLEIDEMPRDSDSNTESLVDVAWPNDASQFELGLWIRGLESFCSVGAAAFSLLRARHPDPSDLIIELNIYRSILLRCSELLQAIQTESLGRANASNDDLEEIEQLVGDSLAMNSALLRTPNLRRSEVNAWSTLLSQRLPETTIYKRFDLDFEKNGGEGLPASVRDLLNSKAFGAEDLQDLNRLLPKFGGLLRCLAVVRGLMDQDVPLRPALAVFAFAYEIILEAVADINFRLAVRRDETSEMFALLDAASYTLAIETKKVFSHELSPLIGHQSATTVYARIESAYGILNDNLSQLLTGFAQLSDPAMSAVRIFPEFHLKLQQSIALRTRLQHIMETVRRIEPAPDKESLSMLKKDLTAFLDEPVSYLFYKDRETFERFCSEIQFTIELKDAGPVLHRFSAYVETLLGQVQLRAVLVNHPAASKLID